MTDTDTSTTPDFDSMPDEDISEIVSAGTATLARRQTVADAERRTDALCLEYLQAAGRVNGGPWEQPTGFIGAYPTGWRVTHDGGTYEAAAPGVTTAPPGDGWGTVDADTALIDFWEPRLYSAGDTVRDDGRIWTATSDVDGQRPAEYPGGWTPTI